MSHIANTMTLSARISEALERDAQATCEAIGVSPSDLVREGLARVIAEFKTKGFVRFGNNPPERSRSSNSIRKEKEAPV